MTTGSATFFEPVTLPHAWFCDISTERPTTSSTAFTTVGRYRRSSQHVARLHPKPVEAEELGPGRRRQQPRNYDSAGSARAKTSNARYCAFTAGMRFLFSRPALIDIVRQIPSKMLLRKSSNPPRCPSSSSPLRPMSSRLLLRLPSSNQTLLRLNRRPPPSTSGKQSFLLRNRSLHRNP